MHHWVAIVTDVPWPWASQQHAINPLNRKQAKKQLFTLELHIGTFTINFCTTWYIRCQALSGRIACMQAIRLYSLAIA